MFTIKQFDSVDSAKETWQSFSLSNYSPFQSWWYVDTFIQHFSNPADLILLGVYEGEVVVAVGGFERVGDTVLFIGMKPVLGTEEVTDFGDILIDDTHQQDPVKVAKIWGSILTFFREQGIAQVQLDYVRDDSISYSIFNTAGQNDEIPAFRPEDDQPLAGAGMRVELERQEVSPYVQLPDSWDEYLKLLPRKKRHELKRKIRRLEDESAFQQCQEHCLESYFDDFIRLHRLSDPAKDQFMSPQMEDFFRDVVQADKPQWQSRMCCLEMDNKKVAAVVYFTDGKQIQLYNSGFDPEYAYYSVGLLLKAFLIKNGIEQGYKVCDFLRGDERYKYDLGAVDRKLYRITVNLSMN